MDVSVRSRFRVPRGIRLPARRARRTGRKDQSLQHDLASYTSPDDLSEIEAIFDRYDDAKTKKIRCIFFDLHRR
jgi:hypothetical protein